MVRTGQSTLRYCLRAVVDTLDMSCLPSAPDAPNRARLGPGTGFTGLLFYALTGQPISFGNFCVIPIAAVRRLAHMPELWNNLAASIMRSRLSYTMVPTTRGCRLAGRSKMNLVSLILHGLTAMSVYTDTIFVRILLVAAFVAATAGLGIAAVVGIRTATDLAIPGWATVAAGDLLIILLQTLVIVVVVTLTFLAGRSHRPFVPIVDCPPFIAYRERRRAAAGHRRRSRPQCRPNELSLCRLRTGALCRRD